MTVFIVMGQEDNDNKMTRILRCVIQPDLMWLRKVILMKYFTEAKERNNCKKWDIGNQ